MQSKEFAAFCGKISLFAWYSESKACPLSVIVMSLCRSSAEGPMLTRRRVSVNGILPQRVFSCQYKSKAWKGLRKFALTYFRYAHRKKKDDTVPNNFCQYIVQRKLFSIYVLCHCRTLRIKALHNFLSSVSINYVWIFIITLCPLNIIHLHNLARAISRCSVLTLTF